MPHPEALAYYVADQPIDRAFIRLRSAYMCDMLRIPLVLLALAPSVATAGGIGHCTAGQTAWFSAAVKGSDKVVSLCGSLASNGKPGWLEYRFGRPGAVELRYPDKRTGSLRAFTYRRYTRPRTTYLRLEFTRDGLRYAIDEAFEADMSPQSSVSLNVVRSSDGKEVASYRLTPETEPLRMMRLEDKVPTRPYQ